MLRIRYPTLLHVLQREKGYGDILGAKRPGSDEHWTLLYSLVKLTWECTALCGIVLPYEVLTVKINKRSCIRNF